MRVKRKTQKVKPVERPNFEEIFFVISKLFFDVR